MAVFGMTPFLSVGRLEDVLQAYARGEVENERSEGWIWERIEAAVRGRARDGML